MKPKSELGDIIGQISSADSPVGMDAVYVHALIIEKLGELENKLQQLDERIAALDKNGK